MNNYVVILLGLMVVNLMLLGGFWNSLSRYGSEVRTFKAYVYAAVLPQAIAWWAGGQFADLGVDVAAVWYFYYLNWLLGAVLSGWWCWRAR